VYVAVAQSKANEEAEDEPEPDETEGSVSCKDNVEVFLGELEEVEPEPEPQEQAAEEVQELEVIAKEHLPAQGEGTMEDVEQEQVEEAVQEPAVDDAVQEQVPNEVIGLRIVGIRLTPTKKKRKMNGETTKYKQQGKCRVCKTKTTYICSLCRDEGRAPEPWFCHYEKRQCYSAHLLEAHP
jgi:hypothetical protein